jgi:transcription elongation factor GreB
MMSRGFVKEDDQEEVPLVPPRADLPAGTENFVTQNGMDALLEEKEDLLRQQESLDLSHEKEYRISFNHINAKLQLLNERITSAKIIDQKKLPDDEIHFGVTVTFKNIETNINQTFQLVGVDEANISKGKLAFTTPLAKALLHKKVGEKAILKLGEKENIFEIVKIINH